MIQEHQRIGQIITAELPFKQVRALLVSLYLERHGKDDDYATLRNLMVRARQVEEQRNQIVHSIWGAGAKPDTITRIKSTAKETAGLRFTFQQYDESRLASIAAETVALSNDITRFWIHLMDRGKAINSPIEKLS